MKRFFSLASVLVLAAGMSAAQSSNASAAHKHSKAAPAANDAAQTSATGDAAATPSSTATQPADAAASKDTTPTTSPATATTANDTSRNNGMSDTSANPNRAESRGNGSNWGWIGLFGLLGLLPRGQNRAVTPIRSSGTDTGKERIRRVG